MYANSKVVTSNQNSIHAGLHERITRHAATVFRKPIADYSHESFERSMAAWRAAGGAPLILDSGCGVGLSTLYLASSFPRHFVIGVDQSADRLSRHVSWPRKMPSNFIRIRADLVDYWRLLRLSGIGLDRHYLLYPNPWPKKRHVGRRWHGHPSFIDAVVLGGHFECRSNWRIYIEECATALSRLSGNEVRAERYLPVIRPGSRPEVTSPFEQKYLDSGHQLWRCRTSLDPAMLRMPEQLRTTVIDSHAGQVDI